MASIGQGASLRPLVGRILTWSKSWRCAEGTIYH